MRRGRHSRWRHPRLRPIARRLYLNACPHIGVPLDWAPGRFLSSDASRIVCSMHGAEFAIETGLCTKGPCLGDCLEAVMIEIRDGIIHVAGEAGL